METLLTESMIVASLLLGSSEFLQELREISAKDGAQLEVLEYHAIWAFSRRADAAMVQF
jgi:hypothetical protein